jgi:hypothetical protein
MRKLLLYLTCCLFTAVLAASSYEYELSACAIFQNEAPYLKEWIEYHRMLGVEHFYLYNNSSTDNYKEVLAPYIKKNIVEVTNWPSPIDQDWTPYQIKAYNDCIQKCKKDTYWLAIIDIDEFIVPVKSNNLRKLLKEYKSNGGLQIFWLFFGTSGIQKIPDNMTMVEALTHRAETNYGPNHNFKTIVHPKAVAHYNVHGGEYKKHWHEIFPHGTRGGAAQPINVDIVRIHHYWTRDEDYFINYKVPRRERCEGTTYTPERIADIFRDLNVVEDTTILRFVPELRRRLGKS